MYLFSITHDSYKSINRSILDKLSKIDYDVAMKIILQSLILILSFSSVFIWSNTDLHQYNIQALASLVGLYIVISFIRRKKNPDKVITPGNIDILILNSILLLLILITGALYSPLFFLIYFLSFGITFLFSPVTVFIFAICSVFLFLPEAMKNNALESYIKLASLILLSPLAYFFGQSYTDKEKEKSELESMAERSRHAADTISKDVQKVISKEQKKLDSEDIKSLNEILEETEALRIEQS